MFNDRQSQIRSFLFDRGQTSVRELARQIGASAATVRRDLSEMEATGLVERLHGSARIAVGAQAEVAFDSRERQNLPAKRALASAASTHLRAGTTIFLDAGTTVLQLARKIKLLEMPLTIFTNGMVVAQELAGAPAISICLLGGRLRSENMSMVGALAESMLDGLWFDQLFLGASAISEDGWISSYDADEACANKRMVSRAEKTFILADKSKFDMRATYGVFRLSGDEHVITDEAQGHFFAQFAEDVGLIVEVASKEHDGD